MEILNVTCEPSTGWLALGLVLAIASFFIAIGLFDHFGGIGVAICGVFFVAGLIITGLAESKTLWTHTEYEVKVNNDSGYEYLMENYEVVEQRGKIWVVKEKRD